MLLIDERPEEVTEMQRSVRAFGGQRWSPLPSMNRPARHVQVADMVIEKAKRLAEHKRRCGDFAGLHYTARSRL